MAIIYCLRIFRRKNEHFEHNFTTYVLLVGCKLYDQSATNACKQMSKWII